jgi:hypothetical protein
LNIISNYHYLSFAGLFNNNYSEFHPLEECLQAQ